MREIIMKKNYAKTFKRLAILAVLLAVFSAIALPLSFSQQIQDLTAIMQSEPSQPALQHDKHDAHQEFDHEEWWKVQITPLSAANYAILGGTAVLWIALLCYYWLLVMAWLYKSAIQEHMNKSLWPILGMFTNLLAVFAFLIIRDNPRRAIPSAAQ